MTGNGVAQIVFYLVVLTALTPPLGAYIARVYEGRRIPVVSAVLGPVERLTYRALRIDDAEAAGLEVLRRRRAGLQRRELRPALRDPAPAGPPAAQPERLPRHDLVHRLQHGGELRDQHQLAVLRRRVDALLPEPDGRASRSRTSSRRPSGMAVLAAVIRGFARRGASELGNFWADLVRVTLYLLLPLAIVVGLFLGSQGVVQTLLRPDRATRRSRPARSARPTTPARRSPRASTAARRRRRSRSSRSGPTAAATSTPTRRCRSRTPRR